MDHVQLQLLVQLVLGLHQVQQLMSPKRRGNKPTSWELLRALPKLNKAANAEARIEAFIEKHISHQARDLVEEDSFANALRMTSWIVVQNSSRQL